MNINDQIKEKGWYFLGQCGCVPKMNIYRNEEYPELEIRAGNQKCEFREYGRVKVKTHINNLWSVYDNIVANATKSREVSESN